MSNKEVYIVSAVRTPLGSFGGMFANVSATELGTAAIKGALEKGNIDPKNVDEVFMGNVCSANLGQAPARQAALAAGIPNTAPCTTVNKVCASGAKSIMFAAQSIMLGHADVLVAGGMENMSAIPYYIPKARYGYKYGNAALIDGLHKDGLLDPYDEIAMGVFADQTAAKYDITRAEQDAYAIRSYQNTALNTENGVLSNEIVGVSVPQRKGDPRLILVELDPFRGALVHVTVRFGDLIEMSHRQRCSAEKSIVIFCQQLLGILFRIPQELSRKPCFSTIQAPEGR